MAITWDEARTKLRGDLWRSGVSGLSDDVCDRALHASILELEAERRWLWLEEITTSAALAAAADELAVPSALSSVQSISWRRDSDTSFDAPLTVTTPARVRALRSGNGAQGLPSCYAFSKRKLYFDTLVPIGAIYELVYTFRTPDELSVAVAAGDANATLDAQETAVIALAGHYAGLGYLKNDQEATRKLAVYQRILRRLENIDNEARGDLHGGLIVPDDYYDVAARGY